MIVDLREATEAAAAELVELGVQLRERDEQIEHLTAENAGLRAELDRRDAAAEARAELGPAADTDLPMERYRRAMDAVARGIKVRDAQPAGCICPAGANETCQAPLCPRKAVRL